MINITNFTGNYTLDNLRPYTEYSVYVTAVRLIGTTGRSLDGEKSDIVTARTLAGSLLLSVPCWLYKQILDNYRMLSQIYLLVV